VNSRWLAVLATLASGCGQLGFDGPAGDDTSALDAWTGSGGSFEPSVGCFGDVRAFRGFTCHSCQC